jgi:hypothetical protein
MLVPVMALFFVMVALAMDALFDTNWGSRVVVGTHVLFAIACAIGVVMDIRYGGILAPTNKAPNAPSDAPRTT